MIGPMEAANVTHDDDRRSFTVGIEVADTLWRAFKDGHVGVFRIERCGDRFDLVITDLGGTVVPFGSDAWTYR